MRLHKLTLPAFLLSLTACTTEPSTTTQTTANYVNLSGELRCNALSQITYANQTIDITSSQYIDSVTNMASSARLSKAQQQAFTPFCKITGYFEKRIGTNNKDYAIGFGLSLPDNWNGKMLFQGGGGLNGLIREPVGALAAGDNPALFRGFAVVSTDSGHQSESRFDTEFFNDQKALLNFYSGAVEKSTQVAKSLINQIYQQAPTQSYFVGCSTGGREAMTMSQRFPEYFDGIIVGAPARQTNYSEIADLWSAKRLRAVSQSGNTSPFSVIQQQGIVSELLAQCDANDGLSDGLIFDVQGCDFDAKALRCSADNATESCLTAPQITALNEAFAGPKTPAGKQVYPGFFFDTGIAASGKKSIPGLLQAVAGPLGQPRITQPFDLASELSLADGFPLAAGNATLTNLSSFQQHGGKLMFFHGVSDPWFSSKDTLAYYQDLVADNGGEAAVSQWSQFYFVPGMGHCRGGEQALDEFDMISHLVDWVEKEQTPESVVAKGQSMPNISRPLCPFPRVSHFKGTGDVSHASSFECKMPVN